jgi:hypothetical protein
MAGLRNSPKYPYSGVMPSKIERLPATPCASCAKPLPEYRSARRKFCSTKCANAKATQRFADLNVKLDVSSGTMGAITELMVSTDLLRRGWEVFRAMSPACSADLVISKKGVTLRIEVRTGYIRPNGTIYWPKKGTVPDHYAVVVMALDERIRYEPELPSDAGTM